MSELLETPSLDDGDQGQWALPENVLKGIDTDIQPGTVKWHVRNRRANGLLKSNAVRRVGRSLLVHRGRYSRWSAGGGA